MRLPDAGFGSYASASFRTTVGGEEVHYAVGEKTNSAGRDLPMIWTVNLTTNTVKGVQLAVPSTFEGEVTDGHQYPNGVIVLCGNIYDTVGKSRAVYWRKEAGDDTFDPPVQVWPLAQQSRMARADYCGNGQALLLAACSVLNGGVWTPQGIYIGSSGAWFFRNLPLGTASQGEALGSDGADEVGGNSVISGSVLLPGVQAPNYWEGDVDGFTSRTLPTFDGFIGRALDARSDGIRTITCGEYANPSSSKAFRGMGGSRMLIPPLSGFASASADSFWLGSNDALGTAVVVGTSWNQGGAAVGTGWLLDLAHPFKAQNLLLDPASVREIRRFRADGEATTTVGEVLPLARNLTQAALFRTTDTQVPDTASIIVGNRIGPNLAQNLWHDDGAYNRVATVLANGVQTAKVNLGFLPMNKLDWTAGELHIVARTLGTGITGTLRVYQRNESNPGYTLIKTVTLTNDAQSINATLPLPMSKWFNALTGAMHTLIVYNGHAGVAQSVVLETVSMTCE